MMNSKLPEHCEVALVNGFDTRLEKVKVMICQLNFDKMDCEEGARLCHVTNSSTNKLYLRRFLNVASQHKIDLLVFPELTVPSEFVNELVSFSTQNDMIIIGGSHYKKTDVGYVSVCPIVTPQGVYYTEKIAPAAVEISSFESDTDGAVPGSKVLLFQNTKIGDFAVTICLDYTNDYLRSALDKDNLDFLIVPAFNKQSDEFFYTMHSDVQRSRTGLYIIYSNALSEKHNGEGRSALFAFVDSTFKSEFEKKRCTDFIPPNKIYEFASDKTYCIFKLSLDLKKPFKSKNAYTGSNVVVVEEDNAKMDNRYEFMKIIGATEDRYRYIDQYYVKPREYDEMRQLLETCNVLLITGDPGIGKTYTAVHLLWEYFMKGYRPTWFSGMGKEDRDTQKDHLLNFEPHEKCIVYLEDPFGKTVFENREELKTILGNLVQKFISCKAKLIITSRVEVFNQFEKENLNSDHLEDFKRELNVRKPSYGVDALQIIAEQYIKDYTDWYGVKSLKAIVKKGIVNRKLISPLMIYNLVNNFADRPSKSTLTKAVSDARKKDLVTQFAIEIKALSYPAKILLYVLLLYGKMSLVSYRDIFENVQRVLFEKIRFEGSSFDFELKAQDNHRIQRVGEISPVYKFSHPAYEEALVALAGSNSTCSTIVEICVSTILKEKSNKVADLFNRFIVRYPDFLENIMGGISLGDFESMSEIDKIVVTRKMILSDHTIFQDLAPKIYPIQKILDGLYGDDNSIGLFESRIKVLNKRRNEIGSSQINWDKIFTPTRIRRMHPLMFISCVELSLAIDKMLIKKISCNLNKPDVIKKYIFLPTEKSREKLNNILSQTEFKGIYQKLCPLLPKGKRVRGKYLDVLKKYILEGEGPKGTIFLDDGAMRAVLNGARLYPVGVVDITGEFVIGDVVCLANNGIEILSLTEMTADALRRYKRLHSSEIYNLEGRVLSTVISKPNYRAKYGGHKTGTNVISRKVDVALKST